MVDWQSPQTVSIPSLNIQKIMILQRRAELIDAIVQYNGKKYNGTENQNILADIIGKFDGLMLEIEAMIERKYKTEWKTEQNQKEWTEFKENYKKLQDIRNDEQITNCLRFINKFLDILQITPVDIRRKIDTRMAEEMNIYKDL